MKVKIKKFYEDAKLPYKKHGMDAGYDLFAYSFESTPDKTKYIYKTGVGVSIPEGYVGLLFPRSSIKDYDIRLSNSVGVIYAGYHREIQAVFDKQHNRWKHYAVGERCCQLIIIKKEDVEWELVDDFEESDRGEDGFGSTGNG